MGLAVLVIPTGPGVVVSATDQGSPDAAERTILTTINQYRKRKGRKPLRLESQLTRAAEHHAGDMTGMSEVVDHTLSDSTWAQQNLIDFGYPADTAYWGENLAVGTTWDTANEAFFSGATARATIATCSKRIFAGSGSPGFTTRPRRTRRLPSAQTRS